MNPTLFFYDLETSGLSPRSDRIMQFAGQRTNLDLEPLGDPVNLLVKLGDDTLPSPHAIMVTKITPQSTQADGLTEAELAKYLSEEIFTENTITLGYNNVRFDDEFIRHLFWRTFYDPYEWQWKDGRSRWDLLDVIRLTRALRPEGITWPVDKDGKATNRLELITKLNGISHEAAHDALSDVTASIDVARLIKEKQPDLYDYLFRMRTKKAVTTLVNLEEKKPFVYASGRYDSEFNKTTVVFPLTTGKNGNIIVYDLRYDPEKTINGAEEAESSDPFSNSHPPSPTTTYIPDGTDKVALQPLSDSQRMTSSAEMGREKKWSEILPGLNIPVVKELAPNKCPAIAPLGVLESGNGWQKIGLDKETIEKHLKSLLSRPDFAERVRTAFESRPEFPKAKDPESALYDAFLDNRDRVKCEAIHNADEKKLADFLPDFIDERLPELLIHYKARNYLKTLSESEQTAWETYRTARLAAMTPAYVEALEQLAKQKSSDPFILEELRLWLETLSAYDY